MLIAAGLLLVYPGTLADVAGAGLVIAVAVLQSRRRP
jgi:UPF0716 family protein affecting phage T7 exclusion